MWQGLQSITTDKLNAFYALFDKFNTELCMRTPAVPEECVILVSETDVSKAFNLVNTRKATGPDGIPGNFLRAWSDQLAGIFTVIFCQGSREDPDADSFEVTKVYYKNKGAGK